MRILSAVVLTSVALWAQEFEVASIRPVVLQPNTPVALGIKIDGSQLRASGLTLRDFLGWGYMLPVAQIDGPDWIAAERFEINAKMPATPDGKTVDDKTMATMLRRLIEDRFAMKIHRTSKEFPVYALVQGKDGIKAKESVLDPEGADGVSIGASGSNQGTTINFGRGASISVASNQLVVTKLDMPTMAENLARYMDRPIVDQTGLKSNYDFKVNLTAQDYQTMLVRAGIAAGMPMPPQALRLLDLPFGDSLHEGLALVGLKLEPKRLPLEVVVIDSIQRTPSEN